MPRSKNPNPRQVMEENEKGTKARESRPSDDNADAVESYVNTNDQEAHDELHTPESQLCSNGVEWPQDDDRDTVASLTVRKFSAGCDTGDERVISAEGVNSQLPDGYKFSPRGDDSDDPNNGDIQIKPRTSLSFSPSSPPSFFSVNSISAPRSLSKTVNTQQNDVRRSKCSSPSVLNVMIWMRNRFHMRPGGRISASDIINLFRADTQHLENPPPGLQNYQVGQVLRRVFPNITRCKITANGKRHWVYKHLNFVENPPDDLFDEQCSPPASDMEDIERMADAMIDDKFRISDSSNFEEGGMGNDNNSPSSSSIDEDGPDVEDRKRQKGNKILLGLLGTKIKAEPLSPPHSGVNGAETCMVEESTVSNGEDIANAQPKKKRDSEVLLWLRENYKFKPGYYVKSMDLLRKYNNGRIEMVKYLSQVGRVMKHVFPAVRHLRKSFKGGKREWVYLNLKPVDIDSDSEEGRSMLMPTMRRSVGWNGNAASITSRSISEHHGADWRSERVNITHTPLSLVQNRNAVFRPKSGVFHRISHVEGNKLVIRRNTPPHIERTAVSTRTIGGGVMKREFSDGNTDPIQYMVDKPAKRTRIVLYNRQETDNSRIQDDTQAPVALERDIFAPFTNLNPAVNAPGPTQFSDQPTDYGEQRIIEDREESASLYMPFLTSDDNTSVTGDQIVAKREKSDGSGETVQEFSGLDLSVKRVWSDATVGEENPVGTSEGHENPNSMGQEALNLSTSLENTQGVCSATLRDGEIASSQTIHYRPSSGDALAQSISGTSRQPGFSPVATNLSKCLNTEYSRSLKRKYLEVDGNGEDAPISWQSLQTFSAQKYGWLLSPNTSAATRNNEVRGKRTLRFVEWFFFSGQWLVNKQRALREIKIYEDWTVVIHALGRRVYPNDLGGITDLEKTATSLNKVFRVLAEAKICMGFPAPSVSDLYIHGILVSKFEVWSSREEVGEDIRQRAVNCQILYSGPNTCCNKCVRILKLHQQQRKGPSLGKRPGLDPLLNTHFRPKPDNI